MNISLALTTDILVQSVGKQVKNTENQYIGEIAEITRNESRTYIEYLILKGTESLERTGPRYFAIPATSKLIKITEAGEIVLLVSEDDLRYASVIAANKCPKPNFQMNPQIFELYKYEEPQEETLLNY